MNSAEISDLDDPVWSALTTGHKALAQGSPLAWRYPPEIGPFAAIANRSEAAFAALAGLIAPEGRIALCTLDALAPMAGLAIDAQAPAVQMVLERPMASPKGDIEPALLGLSDVPDMLDLTSRTRPGPFGPRTIELGHYIGLRIDGRLVAMAGERMRFGRFVEISAVCVDPAHRGKGLAGFFIARLAERIQRQGSVPFMHVYADNHGAIALYEKLGFVARRTLSITVLRGSDTR